MVRCLRETGDDLWDPCVDVGCHWGEILVRVNACGTPLTRISGVLETSYDYR